MCMLHVSFPGEESFPSPHLMAPAQASAKYMPGLLFWKKTPRAKEKPKATYFR